MRCCSKKKLKYILCLKLYRSPTVFWHVFTKVRNLSPRLSIVDQRYPTLSTVTRLYPTLPFVFQIQKLHNNLLKILINVGNVDERSVTFCPKR